MIKLKDLLFETIGFQIYIPYIGEKFEPKKLTKGRLKITNTREYLNKPTGAFWTSTYKERLKTSEWGKFMPTFTSDIGVVFKTVGEKIYVIKNKDDYLKLQKIFPLEYKNKLHIDWQKISKHFDGIHVKNDKAHPVLSNWDVESVAWFNMKPLKFVGTIKT